MLYFRCDFDVLKLFTTEIYNLILKGEDVCELFSYIKIDFCHIFFIFSYFIFFSELHNINRY